MKKKYPNGILNEIFRIKQDNYLAERVKFIKPVINTDCPKCFSFFKKSIPKSYEKGNLSKSYFISNFIFSQKNL